MLDVEGLWETYYHIKKLAELGEDEYGNRWVQSTYGYPASYMDDTDTHPVSTRAMRARYMEPQNICSTNQCFAGWYAYLKNVPMNRWGRVRPQGAKMGMDVALYVIQRSGMEEEAAFSVFHGGNSLDTIYYCLHKITGADPESRYA